MNENVIMTNLMTWKKNDHMDDINETYYMED
jgi:hypothetical protein